MLCSIFTVGDFLYATPVATVMEIAIPTRITAVHGMPPEIEGLMNLRGRIVPVVNAGLCLGSVRVPFTPESRLVFFKCTAEFSDDQRANGMATAKDNVALLVSSIADMLEVDAASVQPLPANTRHPYLSGVIRREEQLISMLELEKILLLAGDGETA